MSRASDRRDESIRWAVCAACNRKHRPGSMCPPVGRWLVLTLCRTCNARTGYYCNTHRGRR